MPTAVPGMAAARQRAPASGGCYNRNINQSASCDDEKAKQLPPLLTVD